MIAVPAGVRVLVWSSPVDFRKGIDGLSAYVQLTLEADPFLLPVLKVQPPSFEQG